MEKINVSLVSLGCSKNLVDSEMMLALLQEEGFQPVRSPADADAIIINTCGFIDAAKEESIQKILEMAQYKDGKCRILLAAGCMAQRFGEELLKEIPELDGIFGTNDVHAAAEAIRRSWAGEKVVFLQGKYRPPEDATRLLATPSHTAFIKIAEGCDNHCTYCAIPSIRGPYRSRDGEAVLREAGKLADAGVKELNLIAQDITLFGLDRTGRLELPRLLAHMAGLPDVHWIRLLYAYPERLDKSIIHAVAELDKVCNYLDLPLQHGSDRILRRMGRKMTAEKILRLLEEVRREIPGITLRSSMIIGFPGEEEEDFHILLDFLREACLDRVGFFTYSREEGTPAARFRKQVPDSLKKERLQQALALQSQIVSQKQKALIGQTFEAMVDGKSAQEKDTLLLRTSMQAPEVDGYVRLRNSKANNGDFIHVRIAGFNGYDLIGEAVK